jgi:predicted small secreted protein
MKALRFFIPLLGLAAFALTGCNTARGFGQDMQMTGERLANRAENAQQGNLPKPTPPPSPSHPGR